MTAYEKFEKQHREKTRKSKELFEEAKRYLPGGVAGSARYRKPYPLYMESAKGATMVDVDGNEYIDFLLGNGPMLLGHSPSVVIEAVNRQLEHGIELISPTKASTELAERICQDVPGMERVSFVNSGSEAVHMLMRVARAYTNRPRVARIEGHYNGQLDNELISAHVFAGPEERPEPCPDSLGIDRGCYENMVILPFHNIEGTVSLIKEYAKELACVIMEPIASSAMGSIPTEKPYMEALRKVTEEEGILLVWDEVITGYRSSLAGAAPYYHGVIPDLRAMGKVIGGGFPVGAYGGKKEVMDKVVRRELGWEQSVWQSGTFSGNIITMVAGLATIDYLEKENPYPRLNSMGERMRNGWRRITNDLGISVAIVGVASQSGMVFIDKPVRNLRDYSRRDKTKEAAYTMGLLVNGITLNLSHVFVSAAHSDEDIDKFLEISESVLEDIKNWIE